MNGVQRMTLRVAHRQKMQRGEKGHKRNAVLMNAGAALYIAGEAEDMKSGIALAAELIDSGKALDTLEKLIEVSNGEAE